MINPDILVDVNFYKDREFARKVPTPANFFSCIFVVDGNNYDCRLFLHDVGSIYPGDSKENVPIKFLCPELVLNKLKLGGKFYLRAIGVFAEGTVKRIITV
jgi:hypothetical protein